MMPIFAMSLCLLSLTLFVACGENGDHDDHDEHSAEQEACTHAQDSPTAVQAGLGFAVVDVNVDQQHTLYEVTLNGTANGTGPYDGFLEYDVTEHADYLIFTSSEVEVEVYDNTLAKMAIASTGVESCEELAQSHRVSLDAGSYVIYLGPSSEQTLSLIIESEGHDHEHE